MNPERDQECLRAKEAVDGEKSSILSAGQVLPVAQCQLPPEIRGPIYSFKFLVPFRQVPVSPGSDTEGIHSWQDDNARR